MKWRNKIKIEENKKNRKVSDGQPASKHGDKSHKMDVMMTKARIQKS